MMAASREAAAAAIHGENEDIVTIFGMLFIVYYLKLAEADFQSS
jgi:hypothetical protein